MIKIKYNIYFYVTLQRTEIVLRPVFLSENSNNQHNDAGGKIMGTPPTAGNGAAKMRRVRCRSAKLTLLHRDKSWSAHDNEAMRDGSES